MLIMNAKLNSKNKVKNDCRIGFDFHKALMSQWLLWCIPLLHLLLKRQRGVHNAPRHASLSYYVMIVMPRLIKTDYYVFLLYEQLFKKGMDLHYSFYPLSCSINSREIT